VEILRGRRLSLGSALAEPGLQDYLWANNRNRSMPIVKLDHRSQIAITGEDAFELLQNLITTDLALVGAGEAWPGALLTPQGKILFEFLVARTDDGLLLETAADNADALIKRFTLYRLRAKVDFNKLEATSVSALRDMRFAKAGVELFRAAGASGDSDRSRYDTLRHANGISGGGEDGPLNDYFPHDLLMDRNGGLSFKKGCYIGQEVVSRMQHRSTARRRLVSFHADALHPVGEPILAGGREIGTILSSTASTGLAVIRIDKAGAAMASGTVITAGDSTISPVLPAWSGLEFPAEADEAAS
jgi:folate-binding protein YgfZ